MKKLLFFLTAVAISLAISTIILMWQTERAGLTMTVESKVLNESRPIRVYLPSSYHSHSSRTYAVLYTVDGEKVRNSSLAALTAKLAVDEPLIVVAINMIGKRVRDLRPQNALLWDKSKGEADLFLEFIEQELVPFVAVHFRTNNKRLLAGHSYGGLFTIHALTQRSHLFDGYLAFSPALNADPTSIQKLKTFTTSDAAQDRVLFMNLGWENKQAYDLRFIEARNLLEGIDHSGFRFSANTYWIGHSLVPVPGYFEGLRFYFANTTATS